MKRNVCRIFKDALVWGLIMCMLMTYAQPVIAQGSTYMAFPEAPAEDLVPRAVETSLEKLAAEGVISPNYLVKNAALAQANAYHSSSFSTKIQAQALSMNGEGLFTGQGLEQIYGILQGTGSAEELLQTPADIDAMLFVKSNVTALAALPGSLDSKTLALAEGITFYIDGLLPRKNFEVIPDPNASLQSTWTADNTVILRWQPEGEWIPEHGYNLYRVTAKKAELIGRNLGAQQTVEKSIHAYARENTGRIEGRGSFLENSAADLEASLLALMGSAKLNDADLGLLGYDNEEAFNSAVYTDDRKIERIEINRDPNYFLTLMQAEFQAALASTYSEEDIRKETVLSGLKVNQLVSQAKLAEEALKQEKMAMAQQPGRSSADVSRLDLERQRQEERLEEIEQARAMIKVQANFDLEFAQVAGLGYVDNLSAAGISTQEEVSYILLPMYGQNEGYDLQTLVQRIHVYNRETGRISDASYRADPSYNPASDADLVVAVPDLGSEIVLKAPETIQGYALNNRASLRWDFPDEALRGVISGYHVYRKTDNDTDYVQITENPVTVPYVIKSDEELDFAVAFEGPVFFSDETVLNGQKVSYKIKSVDFFGRTSEISEASLALEVVKTSLPYAPVADAPYLSTLINTENAAAWLAQAKGRVRETSVLLPISAVSLDGVTSDDVALFNIYRSVAYGKEEYGSPKLIAKVNGVDKISKTVELDYFDKERRRVTERLPGTYYVDSDVSPGYHYRYWVSAVDSWDNESAWSPPVSIAYESGEAPPRPENVQIKLVKNLRPSALDYLPGFGADRIISTGREDEFRQLITGELAFTDLTTAGLTVNPALADSSGHNRHAWEWLRSPNRPDENFYPGLRIGNTIVQPENFLLSKDSLPVTSENEDAYKAILDRSTYGQSFTQATVLGNAALPQVLNAEYMNLPDLSQVLHIVAYTSESVNPDGSLNVSWYHYQGKNLESYVVYRGLVRNSGIRDLNEMDKASVLAGMNSCEMVVSEEDALKDNVYTDRPPTLASSDVYVYLVVILPKDTGSLVGYNAIRDTDTDNAYGSWVRISWNQPTQDSLLNYYRVYKTEVDSLEGLTDADFAGMNYTLMQDRVRYTYCTDSVEQSVAHHYVYKIVPVSLWGVEGEPAYMSVRIPTTIPPAEPEMLIPNSLPGSVEVQFTAVPGARTYNVYRTRVQQVDKEKMYDTFSLGSPIAMGLNLDRIANVLVQERVFFNSFLTDMIGSGGPGTSPGDSTPGTELLDSPYFVNKGMMSFDSPRFNDNFLSAGMEDIFTQGGLDMGSLSLDGINTGKVQGLFNTPPGNQLFNVRTQQPDSMASLLDISALLKFTTLVDAVEMVREIQERPQIQKQNFLKSIIDQYGVLAVADYNSLNAELASTVVWEKIDEIKANPNHADGEPVTYVDTTAVFGNKYLYTVSAANEDLESTRPEPVEATALKGEPFSEAPNIQVTSGYMEIQNRNVWVNHVTWDHATSPYFTQEEMISKWIAGYIVYRSNRAEGPYHQVSGILSTTEFSDPSGSPYQSYHYRVKTVDTAGFITDFDSPAGTAAQTTYTPLDLSDFAIARGAADVSAAGKEALTPGFAFGAELLQQAPLQGFTPFFTQTMPGAENPLVTGIDAIIDHLLQEVAPHAEHYTIVEALEYLKQYNIRTLKFGGYTVTDVNLNGLTFAPQGAGGSYALQDGSLGLFGSGRLILGETEIKIPVNFVIHHIQSGEYIENPSAGYEIVDADIQLAVFPFVETNTDIRFSALNLEIRSAYRLVGNLPRQYKQYFVESQSSSVSGSYSFAGNFIGDADDLYFSGATLSPEGILSITNGTPPFHFGDFFFYDVARAELNLNNMHKHYARDLTGSNARAFPITLFNGKAENSLSYPTLDNKGMQYTFISLGIIPGSREANFRPNLRASQQRAIIGQISAANADLSGSLAGIYGRLTGVPDSADRPSVAQLVAPTGITLKMKNSTVIFGGDRVVTGASNISGEVVLPFFEAPEEFISGTGIRRIIEKDQADINTVILSLYVDDEGNADIVLDDTIMSIFDTVIHDGLLVMDGVTYGLSSIPFSKRSWDGKGILIEHTQLDHVMVGNYDLRRAVSEIEEADEQRPPENAYRVKVLTDLVEQSFVVQSPDISVDLSRNQRLAGLPLNKWYSDASWMGMILNKGTIAISRAVITTAQADSGNQPASVRFNLRPTEMIYDRNGFYYYNRLDLPAGQEMDVDFGAHFGRFKDAKLSYLEVDMIANRFMFSMGGTVPIPALGGSIVEFRAYNDSYDEPIKATILPGQFFLSEPISMQVNGGYFDRAGAHFNGSFSFMFPGELEVDRIRFNELIIPSSMSEMMIRRDELGSGEKMKKGTALFETPFKTSFNGFTTELRSLDLYAHYEELGIAAANINARTIASVGVVGATHLAAVPSTGTFNMSMYLRGSAALSDNLEMPDRNNTQLYLDNINGDAGIVLEECIVDIVMPVGTDGYMSGAVSGAGDKEREDKGAENENGASSGGLLGETVGKDSPSYQALATARDYANEAQKTIGDAQAMKEKIDRMIAAINYELENLDTMDSRINGQVKNTMRQALAQFAQQRDVGRNIILKNARSYVDEGNRQIAALNKRINEFNEFTENHLEREPGQEPSEYSQIPNVEPINKKWVMDYIEDYTQDIVNWSEKASDEIQEFVDGFNLNLFGDTTTDFRIPADWMDDYYITDILTSGKEHIDEVTARLDEVMEHYDEANKYIDQLDSYFDGSAYPGFEIGSNGIVEFKPSGDAFCIALLGDYDFLEGTDIQVEGRMGWDMNSDLFFYAFAVGYVPAPDEKTGEVKGIKLGAVELQNLVGITGYNFILPYTPGVGYTLSTGTAMLKSLGSLQIDMNDSRNMFFAVSADMYIKSSMEKHTCAVKDMLLVIESNGSFQVSGSLFGPENLTALSKPGPNNSKTLYGKARVTYHAGYNSFEFRAELYKIPVYPGFEIGGALGLDWSNDAWMLYLGWPETLKITYTPLDLTGGFGLQLGVNQYSGNAVIKIKMDMAYKAEIEIPPVFAEAEAYVMVIAGYGLWNVDPEEDYFRWYNNGDVFEGFGAGGRLYGRVAGGIYIPGVGKFTIIRLELDTDLYILNPREDYTYLLRDDGQYEFKRTVDANNKPVTDKNTWHLYASIQISYHLDLYIATYSDSFRYKFKTKIDM